MSVYIGIDPGQTGAMAMIEGVAGKVVAVVDYPGTPDGAAEVLRKWQSSFNIKLATLEIVHSMPGQGVVSTFSFGANFGAYRGILAALMIPSIGVAPRTWAKLLGLQPTKEITNKERNLYFAREIWPFAPLTKKKHHSRADALCLAEYGRRLDQSVL
jgi:crossover junction endodeoxyribonuclease RuvC